VTPRRRTRAWPVLSRSFYARSTLEVARDLLGKVLVHRAERGLTSGVIVEVEAYIGEDDPACHAASGPTRRNAPLYGEPGHVYVYLNYGVHYLVNAVTEGAGAPAAVLIRALDPMDGLERMQDRRGPRRDGSACSEHDLCRGPGNLTRAMGIGPELNMADLTRKGRGAGRLWIEDRGMAITAVTWTRRVGIRVGTDRPWRCCVASHPCVSGSGRFTARPSRFGRSCK
jgi:DNA-3-methyladenine glycosylase